MPLCSNCSRDLDGRTRADVRTFSVIFGIAALLLEPVLADGAGVIVLAPLMHRADETIGDQGPHEGDEADHEETHDSIMPSSRRECNPKSRPVFSLSEMDFGVTNPY